MLNITNHQRGENQNNRDIILQLSKWLSLKMITNNKCQQGCGEKGTLVYCWKENWCNHCGKQYGGSQRN